VTPTRIKESGGKTIGNPTMIVVKTLMEKRLKPVKLNT